MKRILEVVQPGAVLAILLWAGASAAYGQPPPPPTVQPAALTFWQPAPDYLYDCAINNRGEVIGTFVDVEPARSSRRGFLLKNSALEPFSVPGFRHTVLTGINDRGDIAGYVYERGGDIETGFIVRDGVTTFLPPVPPPSGAQPLSGYATGDINNRGAVVGSARFIMNNKLITLGWIHQDGAYTIVRYGTNELTGLTGINDRGEAAGFTAATDGNGSFQPIIYHQGQFSILPPPAPPASPNFFDPGYGATAINDRGEVLVTAPRVGVTPTGGNTRSFLYRPGKPYADLTPAGSFENLARSINDHGQICGIWLTSLAYDLITGNNVWRSIGFVRPAP